MIGRQPWEERGDALGRLRVEAAETEELGKAASVVPAVLGGSVAIFLGEHVAKRVVEVALVDHRLDATRRERDRDLQALAYGARDVEGERVKHEQAPPLALLVHDAGDRAPRSRAGAMTRSSSSRNITCQATGGRSEVRMPVASTPAEASCAEGLPEEAIVEREGPGRVLRVAAPS